MPDNNVHSLRSSHREMLIEHLFSGEIMRALWLNNVIKVEVLKPQVDDSGYDLVFDVDSVVRHVQLKASFRGSTVRDVNINSGLALKPSGCVVFVWFARKTLDLGPFAYFGGAPGEPLPDLSGFKQGKHTKANALGVKTIRPGMRCLPLSRFEKVATIANLLPKLFGTRIAA